MKAQWGPLCRRTGGVAGGHLWRIGTPDPRAPHRVQRIELAGRSLTDGKVVGSRVTRSRLRPWPCTGTPSASLKTPQIYTKSGKTRKKSAKTGRPLAPRVAQAGGGGGVRGAGGGRDTYGATPSDTSIGPRARRH